MDSLKNQSYAFVLPRYFQGLAGGAETLCSNLAFKLAEKGHKVEIFTICAKDNRSWENHFQPGSSEESGVTVSRFRVDQRNLDSWIPKQISISQGMRLSIDDQIEWMREGVNSKTLYAEIVKRQAEFDYFFFAPYLFATTFWGSMMVSEKAILIPCLHDETYAYQEVIASMFRQVKGALFNALPEQHLADRLYGKIPGSEVGMGFVEFKKEYASSLARPESLKSPYILYMGRKETGKNVDLLIDYFIAAKDVYGLNPDIKLVIAGGGSFKDLHRDSVLNRGDIVDIERLPENQKHALMKHAALFCQPSTNESFSIVIMESWLLGVPCLVHSDCDVTRYHAEKSGGGLHFCNQAEFAEAVRVIIENKEMAGEMSAAGYEYVKAEYDWDAVIVRFYNAISSIEGNGAASEELTGSL